MISAADFLQLLFQLLDFQARQLGEAHVEDRFGLALRELEPLLQLRVRGRRYPRPRE